MYLLDTNVISELRKAKTGKSDRNVVSWAATASPPTLFVSAITVIELEQGVTAMERRDAAQGFMLRVWLEDHVLPTFEGRVLAIDTAVARRCAGLHVPDRLGERDALIAATALTHGLTVVTRNVSDFAPTGVPLLNPWTRPA